MYLKKRADNTLETGVAPVILQVKQILPSGVLELRGANGALQKEHWGNCLPCHLPMVEGTGGRMERVREHPDLHLALQVSSEPCVVCTGTLEEGGSLFCEKCHDGWHHQCLQGVLTEQEAHEWTCPACNVHA